MLWMFSVVGGLLPVHAQVTRLFTRLTHRKRSRLAVGSLGSWPSKGGRPASGCRLTGTGAQNTSHKMPPVAETQQDQRPVEYIKHSHSFKYTENSSNLFQNCLVLS